MPNGRAMERRRLGTTDLEISRIGLGTWALGGGDWEFAWGPQDDDDSVATLHRAVGLGINWIDTAASYGLGHAEEIVARALSDLPSKERPYVFTKCGLVWDRRGRIRHRLKADSLRQEVEGSLRRLRVEVIDLYQVHWPGFPPDGPAPDLEEGWTTLVELERQGKVRHIGVSNFNVSQFERISPLKTPASLQPPYSLLARDIEREILSYCRRNEIGVIVYSPLQSGLLSGKMTRERAGALPYNDWRRKRSPDFQEPRLSRNLERVEHLRRIARRHARSPAEMAIAWSLRDPVVTGAIVGARHPRQIEETTAAAELRLAQEDLAAIEALFPA